LNTFKLQKKGTQKMPSQKKMGGATIKKKKKNLWVYTPKKKKMGGDFKWVWAP